MHVTLGACGKYAEIGRFVRTDRGVFTLPARTSESPGASGRPKILATWGRRISPSMRAILKSGFNAKQLAMLMELTVLPSPGPPLETTTTRGFKR